MIRTIAMAMTATVIAFTANAATVEQYSVTDAVSDAYGQYGGGHSLTLLGTQYSFEAGAYFTIDDDGSASLTGRLSNADSSSVFDVSMDFQEYDPTPAGHSPKRELIDAAYSDHVPPGPVDTDTWRFWELILGTLSDTGGAVIYDITSMPADESFSFQSGEGANGKNINFGLSGWMFVTDRATSTTQCGPGNGGACDFNLDLTAVALPGSLFLMPFGFAALAGLRRRRRS